MAAIKSDFEVLNVFIIHAKHNKGTERWCHGKMECGKRELREGLHEVCSKHFPRFSSERRERDNYVNWGNSLGLGALSLVVVGF